MMNQPLPESLSHLQTQLLTHLTHLSRDRDPFFATAGHYYVQHYIHDQLSQWGPVETHTFTYQGKPHENLILNLPGDRTQLDRTGSKQATIAPILIAAHYDAVPGSPGADDNATGVAALLEFARVLTSTPARHPVRLIAFDLEELGLLGSRAYVADLHPAPLRLMLSLEMLGYCDRSPQSQHYPPGLQYIYPNQGNFIGLIGNWKTLPDLLHLRHHIRRSGANCQILPAGQAGRMLPAIRRSDHAPFWDAGYGAIMVTDTADFRNPHYHQPSDRLETLDLTFFTQVCHGLMQGIRQLN